MDKIYSRPRLLLPKIKFKNINKMPGDRIPNGKENTTRRKVITILVILIIAFITGYKMMSSIDVIVDKQCEAQAKSIATKISNKQATEVMNKYKYDDLFNVVKDANR